MDARAESLREQRQHDDSRGGDRERAPALLHGHAPPRAGAASRRLARLHSLGVRLRRRRGLRLLRRLTRAPAGQRAERLASREGRQQAEDRQHRHQPAPEVTPLGPHEQQVGERRRDEHQRHPPIAAPEQHRAGQRRQRRDPAESPCQRPQVVEEAALFGRAELALGFGRQRGLVLEFVVEGAVVEQRVGVRDQERGERAERHRRDPGQLAPKARAAPVEQSRLRRRRGRAAGRRPAVYLVAQARPSPTPGEDVVAHPPASQHARAAQQRERQRSQRRHVVERQVRVEDRQEGDGLDRRRQQPAARRPNSRAPAM